ncbi:MAG TPA: type II toxin-antitoxin system RelE/ParE family toxin [Burkholderiaceae bacterium]|nr:type II toxin-antitoxin system RelE/ParE family toxin [Burkholderiaceae bacterium]
MTAVEFSPRALGNLERIFEFLAGDNPTAAGRAARAIVDATRIPERHPLIGRPVRGQLRELVIGTGRGGYAALYRCRPIEDRVEILALRHQREAGYR